VCVWVGGWVGGWDGDDRSGTRVFRLRTLVQRVGAKLSTLINMRIGVFNVHCQMSLVTHGQMMKPAYK
jgi:hypothetical protein